MAQNSKKAGFTLIELIIILIIVGVLGAVTSRVIGETIQHRRFRATLSEMEILKTAIIGDPELVSAGVRTDFGFVGDVGRLPTSLRELVEQGALPSWDVTTGIGWQGPYIERGFADDPDAYRQDGWGNSYTYSSITGVITSLGSDGALGGTGYAADFSTENLTSPLDRRYGTIRGVVTDILGNPLIDTVAVNVRVRILIPQNGIETFLEGRTNTDGVYRFTNIPAGNRRLRAVVGGILYPLEKAVVISGVGSRHDIRVATDVTAPELPTALVAVGVPFSHINLSWNPPTLNTDGTSLIDLAGFNIYREVTTPFTPAPANRIATVGLVDDFTDFATETRYIYYYIIRAFDEAGNESADSTTVSASTANGGDNIRQVSRATRLAQGGVLNYVVVGLRNFSASTITVTRMRVSWMGGAPTWYAGDHPINTYIRIPTTAAWGEIDDGDELNGAISILDGVPAFRLTAAGTTNSEGLLRIGFSDGTTTEIEMPPGAAITIELNPHLTPPTATFNVYW